MAPQKIRVGHVIENNKLLFRPNLIIISSCHIYHNYHIAFICFRLLDHLAVDTETGYNIRVPIIH